MMEEQNVHRTTFEQEQCHTPPMSPSSASVWSFSTRDNDSMSMRSITTMATSVSDSDWRSRIYHNPSKPFSNLTITTHFVTPHDPYQDQLKPYNPLTYNYYAVYNQTKQVQPLRSYNIDRNPKLVPSICLTPPPEDTPMRLAAIKETLGESPITTTPDSPSSIYSQPSQLDEVEYFENNRSNNDRPVSGLLATIIETEHESPVDTNTELEAYIQSEPVTRVDEDTRENSLDNSNADTQSDLATELKSPSKVSNNHSLTPKPSSNTVNPATVPDRSTSLYKVGRSPTRISCPSCHQQTKTRTQSLRNSPVASTPSTSTPALQRKSSLQRLRSFSIPRTPSQRNAALKGVNHYCRSCDVLLARLWCYTGDVEVFVRSGEGRGRDRAALV